MLDRRVYATDLTNAAWALLEPRLPAPKPGGRPIAHSRREICNAIFTSCAAAAPGACCRTTYRRGRPSMATSGPGAAMAPGSASMTGYARRCAWPPGDSRSRARPSWTARASRQRRGGVRGYDAGKKVSGRKRHLLVDTLGLLLLVVVHAANLQDRDGAKLVCLRAKRQYPRLRLIWADGGYRGQLVRWVATLCRWTLAIVKQHGPGFQVLPKRWIVERTFAWLLRFRRLSKDYEFLTETSEAMIQVAMIDLMVRRLARQRQPLSLAASMPLRLAA